MRLKKSFIAVILAGALAAGVFMSPMHRTPAIVRTATLLTVSNPLPEIHLIDHTGAAVTTAGFRGQWDLVFFGFTHCPDICPVTLQILSTSIRQLKENGVDPLPRIVLVSVDPDRDTPEKLAEYVAHFGDNTLGVTGQLKDIRSLTSALGIFFEKRKIDNGDYSVDHSAAVLVINPDGEFHAVFSGRHEVDNFVHDLPIIMTNTP